MDEENPFSPPENYLLLKEDPEALLKLVNKRCTVRLLKNTAFSGFVHSFDPVSKSMILAVVQEKSFEIILIPGYAIIDVRETSQNLGVPSPFKKIENDNSASVDLTAKKSKVMDWFKVNFLPVSEVNDNILFGNVLILPPYGVADICTDNPIVAMQVRRIIEKMPEDDH